MYERVFPQYWPGRGLAAVRRPAAPAGAFILDITTARINIRSRVVVQ
jgi:hypothetical protein